MQSLDEHNLNVAKYAKHNGEKIGLANTCYLAGLLHDVGKGKKEFQNYIRTPSEKSRKRGTIDHSTAGGSLLLEAITGQ